MRIVVDVNVARSSGGLEAKNAHSCRCRNALITIYEKKHKIVLSNDLRAECIRHASEFSVEWYYSMKRDNLIEDIKDARDPELRERILCHFSDDGARRNVEKDIHLIEAALKTDKKIISNDPKERRKFVKISPIVVELQTIIWTSTSDSDSLIKWLNGGATCDLASSDWYIRKIQRS
jgi:hypothetical protein